MNLQVSNNKGRKYLSIVRGYRDPVTKKVKHKSIKSLGYLDDLQKQYPDPIVHFRQVVDEMNEKETEATRDLTISLRKDEILEASSGNRKNLGYAVLLKIYHELGLDIFFNNRSRSLNSEYSVNAIMKLLTFSRILAPASKKRTYEERDAYFENSDFTLDDVYRCLSFANTIKKDLQLHLHQKIKAQYGRKTEPVYYDVTNYYFEIDDPDDLRKKGVCKEHRPDPIVQMGLLMDADGIPISYALFPGNTNDCETLTPMLEDAKKIYGLGRLIVVADKGLNTGSNIAYNILRHDGYVYSQTVRGANKELKDYVLDDEGYRQDGEDYKIKSRTYPREITVTDIHGKAKKVRVDEKQIVFYSKDYDKKAKAERAPAIQKALDIVGSPAKYNHATSLGAARYVKNLVFDKKTGEIITKGQVPVFDEEKQKSEELFDGYYAIVTSELDKSDEEILDIYRGLWRIEESFKVTKSDFEARPVFLSREDRIQAHFLVCFVSLVIARLLQRRLEWKHSVSAIADSLSKTCCTRLEENWYVFDYVDDITSSLRDKLGIDLTRKYLRLGDIKKILAASKIT